MSIKNVDIKEIKKLFDNLGEEILQKINQKVIMPRIMRENSIQLDKKLARINKSKHKK